LFYFFLAFCIFFPPYIVKADTSTDSLLPALAILPGVTCGNSEATDEAQKCCQLDTQSLKSQLSISIPTFGCVTVPIVGKQCVSNLGEDIQSKGLDFALNFPPIKTIITLQQKHTKLCEQGEPTYSGSNCVCTDNPDESLVISLCNRYLSTSKDYGGCINCFSEGGVWSALGCVYINNMKTFIEKNVFGFGLGLGGIAALFCIIYSAFMIQTSQGNTDRVKKAQQLLTSCITGLILIIFSVFILRIIGVNILGIPGFQ